MANFSVEWLSKSFYDEVREAASAKSSPAGPTEEPRRQSLPASQNTDSDFSSPSENEAKDSKKVPTPQTRRKRKTMFTSIQSCRLEKTFKSHKYVNKSQRKTICEELQLSDAQVKTWFQNRRMRYKRALRKMELRRIGCRIRPPFLLPRTALQHPALSGQLLPAGGFPPYPQPHFGPVLPFGPGDNNTPLNLSLHGPR